MHVFSVFSLLLGCPLAAPDPSECADPDPTETPPTAAPRDEDGDGFPEAVDCDDLNPDVHPNATETWYNGVDQDCLGDDDFDQDGDGWAVLTGTRKRASLGENRG